MTLDVDVGHRFAGFTLDAAFSVGGPGITALFGRSGAGKTSIINMIAGLLSPNRGRIVAEGETLFDSSQRIDLAPERRHIGYVFQEDRLFPHMTVRANLDYGRKRRAASARRIEFDQVVDVLGIGHLLARRPHGLSGGEKQRVAIGRALLTSPRLMLMDEPLASLDAARKNEVMPFIERLRDEFRIPIVYVSHAMDEIVRLADTLVLISDGAIAAAGPLEDVMARLDLRPLTGRYEAGAVITGTLTSNDPDTGLSLVAFKGGTLTIAGQDIPVGSRVRVRVRARDVSIALSEPRDISILNIFKGSVAEIGDFVEGETGAQVDVRLDIGVPLWSRITRKSLNDLALAPGKPVYALVKAVAIERQSVRIDRGAEPV